MRPLRPLRLASTALVGCLWLTFGVYAFVVPHTSTLQQRQTIIPTRAHDPLIHGNAFWTAVEVFDGSTIVDPVVVSNVFWTSFQAKLLSFVVGQTLAAVVFSVVLGLFASQLTKIKDAITEKLFPEQPPLKIPRDLQTTIQPDFGKLLICLAIDTIGTSSELLPFVGELTDVVWAPIAGLLLRNLYNSNVLLGLEFTEEILPFTDILPLATICWVVDTFFAESTSAKLLNLGVYSNDRVGQQRKS